MKSKVDFCQPFRMLNPLLTTYSFHQLNWLKKCPKVHLCLRLSFCLLKAHLHVVKVIKVYCRGTGYKTSLFENTFPLKILNRLTDLIHYAHSKQLACCLFQQQANIFISLFIFTSVLVWGFCVYVYFRGENHEDYNFIMMEHF